MNIVLIVEDEKMIRQGIKSMIMRSGVPVGTIIECNNGVTALDILERQNVDVMFTDIRMPKMDGITLVRKMQELENKPVTVVISGYDDFSYAVEMMRMGVQEYILKPIDREQIAAIMKKLEQKYLKKKEEQEEKRQISYQQMRYLCLNKNISQKEKELLCKKYCDSFFTEEYVVCCCNHNKQEYETSGNVIYLGNLEGYQVFLAETEDMSFLLENELKNCYVGCSEPVKGPEMLNIAFMQACNMRKKAFARCEKIMSFESGMELTKDEKELNESEIQQLDAIAYLIGTERVEEMIQYFHINIENVREGKSTVEHFQKQIMHILKQIAQNYEYIFKENEKSISEIQDIYNFQTIEEYENILTAWIYDLHELIHEEIDDYKNKRKIQQALGYIHENYSKDLNMAVVSNHVSMNYSLFSTAFKQYTGKNFVNYLKKLRIQEAKRLLAQTDMRIIDISQSVGYENEKYFMKLFKTTCGVSPTEYRKNMIMKDI